MANVLGLNISSAFNSAVTVYVMIPLLLIPQMILSGLLFSFDKLNSVISTKGKVPLVADLMASRWAYEAMAVYQFKYNSYQKPFYGYEQIESQADFKSSFYVDKLNEKRKYIADNIQSENDTVKSIVVYNLELIRKSIKDDYYQKGLEKIDVDSPWTIETYTPAFSSLLEDYLSSYKQFYQSIYNKAVAAREKIIYDMENEKGADYKVYESKNKYYNESLADLVKNVSVKTRIVEDNGELVQQINPVFADPKPTSVLDYRAQFFAPRKNLLGIQVDTYYFNILIIWLTCLTFYITLYFELLRKFVNMFSKVNLPSNVTLPKMNLKKKK
jgi:hypothetical protein